VERGANLLVAETEGSRLLAVDVDDRLRALDLQIRAHVLQHGKPSHFLLEQWPEAVELIEIAGLERVLIEAPGRSNADIEILDRLKKHVDTGHRSKLTTQVLNDLGHRGSLIARYQLNVECAAVHPHSGPDLPDLVVVGRHIGAGPDDGVDVELL